ncbi:mammalian cell entry protein [Mycolicibacterium peregrinum]|uniref:Mammalian cell entry protein n=1 Tax=Mycolicibacterium peregrinum TaxID=43304 RepID=A0A1A0QZ21_MYCPR|nr:mammalian cell entry protein [Mycolicibacterium peregrinum]
MTVNSLPQPGNAYRDGYDLTLEFSNVLNLPDRAKVVLDGTPVGVVTAVNVEQGRVDVTARIDSVVTVPANSRATLQQATVLGDTYLALERPGAGAVQGAPIPPDGRIPLAQTVSPPQLEDTLANLANFIGSGSIQRVQTSIMGLNRVTPKRSNELRAMVSRVAEDLSDLSDNIDTVDHALDGLSQTGTVLNGNRPNYRFWFSDTGMLGFDRATETSSYIGTLVPSIGSIYSGGYWMTPMLNSLADAMGAVQQSKWAVEDEHPKWQKLMTEDFMPADKYPAINITSITAPDGRELLPNVQDVLRILGAMP